MTSVYVRYLLPALVVVGAALTLLVRRRLGRHKAALDRSHLIVDSKLTPAPTDPASEQAWYRLHGEVLNAWMTAHEDLLDRASEDDFSGAQAVLDEAPELAPEHLDTAVVAHPNPLRRAELSAMRAAASFTLTALAQGDYTRARHHHLIYCDYRESWQQHA